MSVAYPSCPGAPICHACHRVLGSFESVPARDRNRKHLHYLLDCAVVLIDTRESVASWTHVQSRTAEARDCRR